MELTIQLYLQGCVSYPITNSNLLSILSDRHVEPIYPVTHISKRTKDLLRADVYMHCANRLPLAGGGTEDSHGGWKHKEGRWECSESDKRNLRKMANKIYELYGEYDNIISTSVKIQKL